MEQEILNLLRKNKIGHAKAHYLKHELLRLFNVSGAVAFANAMGYNYEYLGDNKWQQKDDSENMIIDVRQYTTAELYEIFEKKKAKATDR